MRLPNHHRADVPREKVTQYLLNRRHPRGAAKAAFFQWCGFREDDPDVLRLALLGVGMDNEVVATVVTGYGTRYVVDGTVTCPNGREVTVRTVWFVDPGAERARLVTAYPAKEQRHDS